MLVLCYLRVPTWAPFRLQFYFDGHNFLAHKLDLEGIGLRMIDKAFVRDVLAPLYVSLTRTATHVVKREQVATLLGHRLTDAYEGEIGNDLSTRREGTRIKHDMGPATIKMYDGFTLVLRVETTYNDVTFFKYHRRVEHRDGTWGMKLAPMRKSI